MNYRLLTDAEILRTKRATIDLTNELNENNDSDDSSDNLNKNSQQKDLSWNASEGRANQCLSELFQHDVKAHEIKLKVDKWKSKGQTIKDSINKGMRLTIGTL